MSKRPAPTRLRQLLTALPREERYHILVSLEAAAHAGHVRAVPCTGDTFELDVVAPDGQTSMRLVTDHVLYPGRGYGRWLMESRASSRREATAWPPRDKLHADGGAPESGCGEPPAR